VSHDLGRLEDRRKLPELVQPLATLASLGDKRSRARLRGGSSTNRSGGTSTPRSATSDELPSSEIANEVLSQVVQITFDGADGQRGARPDALFHEIRL
jgi:hypothetical protein